MFKPGYTYRNGDKVIYILEADERAGIGFQHLIGALKDLPIRHNADSSGWTEVCKGRHSNPEELLSDPQPVALTVGDVRIGTATGLRFTVLAIDGDAVWVDGGPEANPQRDTWGAAEFLRTTRLAPTFFEEGHDYERQIVAGGIVRVTVRRVGQMPNGTEYAVAERRNGSSVGEPALLTAYDFPTYEDVTK